MIGCTVAIAITIGIIITSHVIIKTTLPHRHCRGILQSPSEKHTKDVNANLILID